MAAPNIVSNTSVTQAILANAQLASGNNDFTVPAGTSWSLKSFALTNVSGSAASVAILVVPSGGTARTVLSSTSIAPGDGLAVDTEALLAMLPELAILRIACTAGSVSDLLITGVIAA